MSRKRIVIILFLAVLAVLLWWWLRPNSTPPTAGKQSEPPASSSPTAATQPTPLPMTAPIEARRKAVVEKILGVLATPITFYGKAVDQNGDPVPDAKVGYSALDKFMAEGTGYTGTSDQNGNFSIAGIKGARLSVNVRKEGYYFIDGKSNAAFAYGTGPDGYFKNPPTKENPAVFFLQKMGVTEPLIQIESRNFRIQRNGTPVNVSLETGQVSPQGEIRVEAWTEDDKPDARQHYNWRCRVSVPNGGLVERKGQFDFEAPTDGYKSSDESVIPQTAENWTPYGSRGYFVKLADGRYARIQFDMFAGGDHFFKLESYLNPKPGSRNLEFDPAKVVQSP